MSEVTIKFRRGTSEQWASTNPILGEGEIGVDLTTRWYKMGDGVTHWNALPYSIVPGKDGKDGVDGINGVDGRDGVDGINGTNGADGFAPRETATYTSSLLLNKQTENGLIDLQAGYRILRIQTNVPARVRLYDSVTSRTNDEFRVAGVDPTGSHGVILDFVTSVDILDWWMNPVVDGYMQTDTFEVPIAVTNLDVNSQVVTTTLTWVRSE